MMIRISEMESTPLPYVVFAYVAMLIHLINLSISIFLIVVIQSTQLHKNCKFLLSVWGVSLSSLYLYIEHEDICITDQQIRSTFTLLLGWITEVGLHIIAAVGIFILEMCSLTMNSKAVKYCRRRKIELRGSFSLNIRGYQVKEAYQLAVSMQRAYLYTFIVKNSFNGFIMTACYKADDTHMCVPLLFELPYFVLESVYGVGLTTTFLLTLWGLSYMTQFVSHAAIFVLNTTMTSLPLNKQDPRIRGYLITVSAGTQAFSETLEIMIASERVLSSMNPEKYHLSRLNLKMLIPYTLVAGNAALIQSWVAQDECSGRVVLRSEVKEARELAVSMQRAYLVTFVAKNLVNSVIVVGCIRVDEERNCIPLLYPLSFTVLEGSTRVQDVFEAPKIESPGTVYFDDLRRAWN
ncbi:hypothetical protein PRIPAC_77405 [Pristionchus pacificus]|uniref:Uncharacterized protein n=1 Tax=Pristionchus pacificus TaxID=54126 RepID=A0A2A6C2D8_PRIPA|nr:hypothetical protein PRIPAC_77405 [Pristionchus pacificus]|eukprot:PDM72310.1 hypothetical protein PRIPAC_38744 [Pristionchus pacificus]